jgi:hypothetical protein
MLGHPDPRLPACLWRRDQRTPVALTFDYHSVVTGVSLSIGATVDLSPASRAADTMGNK